MLKIDTLSSVDNTVGAWSCDIDHDLEMEIFILNTKQTIQLMDDNFEQHPLASSIELELPQGTCRDLVILDYNNDGWDDLFICGQDRNYLLLNIEGKYFKDIAAEVQIAMPPVEHALSCDINQDGQIDLFAMRKGENILWINQNDTKDFINIQLHNAQSAFRASYSEIKLYQSNVPDSCIYREITGSRNGSPNYYHSPDVHIGVEPGINYDIHVNFASGMTRRVYGVSNGEFINIYENNSLNRVWNKISAAINYRLFQKESYSYISLFVIFFMGLFKGLQWGSRLFQWNQLTIYINILFANLFFWISLLIFHSYSPWIRYAAPLGLAGIGFLLAFFFSWQQMRLHRKKRETDSRFELFSELLIFSHGDWAMSTFNGLIMLYQALNSENEVSVELKKQIEMREKSYRELLSDKLMKLVELTGDINDFQEFAEELKSKHFAILEMMNDKQGRKNNALAMKTKLADLKEIIRSIRKKVNAYYTSDFKVVLQNLLSSYAGSESFHDVDILLHKQEVQITKILFPAEELADVLDNLFKNAIRAMSEKNNAEIHIHQNKTGSRLQIDICDNGHGIAKDYHEKIFDHGVSLSGSSGTGLAYCRNIVEKYGAKIELKSSKPGVGTCFRLEFHEGVEE